MRGETLRHALNVLAEVAPDWLLARTPPEWFERYSHRFEEYRFPKAHTKRLKFAETIGADGSRLLTAVYGPSAPAWLAELPALETLRRVWVQQFFVEEGHCRWCSNDNLPPLALIIASPYESLCPDSGSSVTTAGLVISVHLTETCDDDKPHLIVHTETRCRDHAGLGHGRTDSLRLRATGLPSQQACGGWGLCGCRCHRDEPE